MMTVHLPMLKTLEAVKMKRLRERKEINKAEMLRTALHNTQSWLIYVKSFTKLHLSALDGSAGWSIVQYTERLRV